jgi:predicted PurR-regulated permease PerM
VSELRKGRTTLVSFLVLLIGSLAVTGWMIGPYLLSIVMGAILALLFRPIFRFLLVRRLGVKWSALLTTLAIVFLVIGPLAGFAIRAVKQGIVVGEMIGDNPALSMNSIVQKLSDWGPIDALIKDPAALETQIRSTLKGGAQGASALVLKGAAQIPNILLQLVLTSLTCFFVLVDGRSFTNWMSDKIPLDSDVRRSLADSFRDTAISVIWATLAAAGGQALIIMLGYWILGIPNIFLAGGATFIFAWIPMIGCTPVWVVGALYLYFQGSIAKAIIMVVIGLVAGIADNFIRPIVLKDRSAIHPLVSLVAIFGGIQMFGLMGVFIGPIIVAILISLLDAWPEIGRKFGLNFRNEKMSETPSPKS